MGSARHRAVTRMAGRLWWLPLAPLGFISDRGSRRRWLFMPAIVVTTAFTSSAVKLLVRRPRPNASHRRAPLWNLDAAGFPSTHSACAFAVAGWMRGWRHGRRLCLVALLISCLRVQRRAHHLADVMAGPTPGYALVRWVERAWSRLTARGSDKKSLRAPEEVRPHAPERSSVEAAVPVRTRRQRGHVAKPGERGPASRFD